MAKGERGCTIYRRSTPRMRQWLDQESLACAGPYPCITGMRNKYWGKSANIVRCGRYAYLLKSCKDPYNVPQL